MSEYTYEHLERLVVLLEIGSIEGPERQPIVDKTVSIYKGLRAQSLVHAQLGGADRTIRLISDLLDRPTSLPPRARSAA